MPSTNGHANQCREMVWLSTVFSILMAVNLVSMTARSRGISKLGFSPAFVAEPEVSGGEYAGDGLKVLGGNAQDGSPPLWICTTAKVRLAVVPLSGCWSVRDTLRSKHTQRIRKVETEKTTALTACRHSPALGRTQEGRGEKGLTRSIRPTLRDSAWRTGPSGNVWFSWG